MKDCLMYEHKDFNGCNTLKARRYKLLNDLSVLLVKGTIRANHYHPQQEQKCLFTKGQIIEIFQDIINPNAPKITQVVNAGQLSVIKPNVAHTMVFSKDTTFLNLVRGERDHENYGITHTIKHVLLMKRKNYY